ncbi:MAG: V-type ATPase subunit [Candidatus Woesearchaeota archaeon]
MYRKASKTKIPYTCARVRAMKSKLIHPDEYHKLLKLDLNSITRYLQDSRYKDSLTKLSLEFQGIELIDMALRREQYRTFNKLREISPESVVSVLDLYLGRFDVHNLKVVLRGLYSGAQRDEVFRLIEPIGRYRKEYFMDLFDLQSVKKVLEKNNIFSLKDLAKAYDSFKENNSLVELENQMDKLFFMNSIEGANQLKDYGIRFQGFLLMHIDVMNMKNLMRFKREGMDSQQIMDYMIIQGQHLAKEHLLSLAKTKDVKDLVEKLQKTFYGRRMEFSTDVFDTEIGLDRLLNRQALLRSYRNPLSIETVLDYTMAKITEIRNLRSIIKAKYLGIDADYVEKKLLIK